MTVSPLTARRAPNASKLEQAHRAAARASRLQADQISERVIDVVPGLTPLLPGGGLKPGTTYAVQGSTALTASLLAAASSAGLWCGVVGMPGFSAEAAAGLGCDLERIVFVPQPGQDWINVVASLADALTIVVARPAGSVSDAQAARLTARLRQRQSVLIASGPWPRADVTFRVAGSSWLGLGSGYGHLTARQLDLEIGGRGALRGASAGGSLTRHTAVWLPDRDGNVRCVGPDQVQRFGAGVPELHEAVG